ncbi:MAG: hypothetical protein AAFN30_08175 [Actinomycetota bacterium]
MIIAKGGRWGEPAPDAPARHYARLDQLALAAMKAAEAGEPLIATTDHPDILTQLGLSSSRPPGERFRYPFDLGVAELDDGEVPFVAHLEARRAGWTGPFAVVMNVGWIGDRYFGPRAHPNDGLLDITVGSLGWRQRLSARRRLATGSHLPHPGLATPRRAAWSHRFPRPVRVSADGRMVGKTRSIAVRCVPDCLTLIV